MECVICFDEEDSLELSSLECGHNFHQECINKWFEKSNTCPLCRKTFVDNTNITVNTSDEPIEFSYSLDPNTEFRSCGSGPNASRISENTIKDDECFWKYYDLRWKSNCVQNKDLYEDYLEKSSNFVLKDSYNYHNYLNKDLNFILD